MQRERQEGEPVAENPEGGCAISWGGGSILPIFRAFVLQQELTLSQKACGLLRVLVQRLAAVAPGPG